MRTFVTLLALAACTPFPELEGAITDSARAAPFPELTPLPDLPKAAEAESDALNQRIAALQARAARIRQIDIAALQ